MKDNFGDRIKAYEDVTRSYLPRRTYTLLRLDGKAFHTYTKGLQKPFDENLMGDMDTAVWALMAQIQNAKFAYVQSDEISILVTDVEKIGTSAWFDGNIQKIASVSSSILTAEFNKNRFLRYLGVPDSIKNSEQPFNYDEYMYYYDPGHIQDILTKPQAHFDCRVFSIPDRIEVMNYFRWRNQDCRRNSISMVAQSLFSHKELQGKGSMEKIQMIFNKTGSPYDSYTDTKKFGRLIIKGHPASEGVEYKDYPYSWRSIPAWDFSKDDGRLLSYIPEYGYE